MTPFTHNIIAATLEIAAVIALLVVVVSLIGMVVRWKTPKRRGHVIRVLISLGAIPCLIGIDQAIQRLVFLPSLARENLAIINEARADELAKTSVVHVGDSAPHFSLTTADGDEFSLPQGGHVVLINFFATWCGPCRIELPHIEQIWTANKDNRHFRMLVIGREESMETVREYRDQNGFTFPIAPDPNREVYALFAKQSIPRTVVVSPNGLIVYSSYGFIEEDLDELNTVLQEQLASLR